MKVPVSIRRNQSIMNFPIPVGVRADGEIAYVVIVRDEGGVHGLTSGMNGSGKTWGEQPVLLTCGALQVDQILMDPVKGVQSYSNIAGCLQMYEIDRGRCQKLIRRLLNHTLPARTNHLAREGLQQWSPRSTLRFLRVHIEEAWRLSTSEELVGLGVALRSAGGQLTLSLQQPTYDNMSTTLRNQMGVFRCYGLNDGDYTQYSLPEDVVAAGARPERWGNDDPGMHYLVGPKMTIRQKTMPVRSFSDGAGPNSFVSAAALVAANLGPMCTVTAGSLGELWDTHVPPLELIKQAGVVIPGQQTRAALGAATADVSTIADQFLPPGHHDQDDDGGEDGGEPADDVDPELVEAIEEALDDLYDPDYEGDEHGTVTEEDDGRTLVFTSPDGDEFVIDLTGGAGDDDLLAEDDDGPVDEDVARKLGDPPRDGATREEFVELLTARVTAFLASGEPTLERRSFVNFCADTGWSMASVYKYLERDERIEKADRGWIPVRDAA